MSASRWPDNCLFWQVKQNEHLLFRPYIWPYHDFMGLCFYVRKLRYYFMDKMNLVEEELDVEFTQFLFPDGRRRQVWIARPVDTAKKALMLQARGFKFEIENDDERIWMSCIDHERDLWVDKFCHNGVDVPKTVDELIETAFARFIV